MEHFARVWQDWQGQVDSNNYIGNKKRKLVPQFAWISPGLHLALRKLNLMVSSWHMAKDSTGIHVSECQTDFYWVSCMARPLGCVACLVHALALAPSLTNRIVERRTRVHLWYIPGRKQWGQQQQHECEPSWLRNNWNNSRFSTYIDIYISIISSCTDNTPDGVELRHWLLWRLHCSWTK